MSELRGCCKILHDTIVAVDSPCSKLPFTMWVRCRWTVFASWSWWPQVRFGRIRCDKLFSYFGPYRCSKHAYGTKAPMPHARELIIGQLIFYIIMGGIRRNEAYQCTKVVWRDMRSLIIVLLSSHNAFSASNLISYRFSNCKRLYALRDFALFASW